MVESCVRQLIDEAVAEGRVNRLPTGYARGLISRAGEVRFHPDMCDRGSPTERSPFLDELDGDGV